MKFFGFKDDDSHHFVRFCFIWAMGKKRGIASRRGREELKALGVTKARNSLKVQATIKKKKTQVRQEKHDAFIEKVLTKIEGEQATKNKKKKKKRRAGRTLLRLGAIGDALDDVEFEKKERVAVVVRSKTRSKILEEEIDQVSGVLKHPAFQENPMEALRTHLMNTVTQDPEAVPPSIAKKRKRHKKPEKEQKEFRSGRQIRAAGKRRDRLDSKARDAELAAEIAKKKKTRGFIGEKRPKILE